MNVFNIENSMVAGCDFYLDKIKWNNGSPPKKYDIKNYYHYSIYDFSKLVENEFNDETEFNNEED